jgi:hypothetical protein
VSALLGCSFSGRLTNKASAAARRSVYLAVHASLDIVTGLLFSFRCGSGQRQKHFLPHWSHSEVHRNAHQPHIYPPPDDLRSMLGREGIFDKRFGKALLVEFEAP